METRGSTVPLVLALIGMNVLIAACAVVLAPYQAARWIRRAIARRALATEPPRVAATATRS